MVNGNFMYIRIKNALSFIFDGFNLITCSARMDYSAKTKGIEEFRSELFTSSKSSFLSDKINFKNDRRNIGLDMRRATSVLEEQIKGK
jgi:hypothetical protein